MIDFHCHLDLYPDPQAVAQRCDQMGLYVLSVTTTPSAWEGTSALERGRIRTALGLHPQLAGERIGELELFDELVGDTPYVGEIGLDGAPEFKSSWDEQVRVFDHILGSCAKVGGRVLSIHSRRAVREVLERLADNRDAGMPVLHWFTGTKGQLEQADQLGCWFSVGPPMMRSQKARELVTRMPRDRVLTESDGPFTRNKDQPIYPWNIDLAVRGLAELWDSDCDTITDTLKKNLETLVAQAPG